MKARIVKHESNGKNYAHEKELVSAYSVVALIKGELKEVVTARAYMGRSRTASTVYASIWVHASGVYTAGHGSAGGYGYHKESQAFQEAISSAGIELYGDVYNRDPKSKARAYIGGVGESAMRAAFEAIARAAGARGKLLFISH